MNDKTQLAGSFNAKPSQNLTLTFLLIDTIIVEKITSITGCNTVSSSMLMIYGFQEGTERFCRLRSDGWWFGIKVMMAI
jgi:hypothetical protein